MRIVLDRNRGGAYLTSTLVGAGLIGAFFFLSLYFQQVLGYTPVEAGFASLPTTLGVFISAGAASALVPKVGPKPLMVARRPARRGRAVHCCRSSDVDSGFWELAFPGQLLLGLGPRLHVRAAVEPGARRRRRARRRCGQRDAERDPAGRRLDRHRPAGHAVGGRDHQLHRRRAWPPARNPQDPAVGLQAQVEGYTTAFTWAAVLLVARRAGLGGADQGDQGGPAGRGDAVVHAG